MIYCKMNVFFCGVKEKCRIADMAFWRWLTEKPIMNKRQTYKLLKISLTQLGSREDLLST